jgi:opacity protein-like surface antigen
MQKIILWAAIFLTLAAAKPAEAFEYYPEAFYISILGGANFSGQVKMHHVTSDARTEYVAAAALGYRTCNNFRMEIEAAYRRNSLHRLKIHHFDIHLDQPAHGNFQTISGMVNLVYDAPFCFCLRPYIGFGIGWAHNLLRLRVSQDGEVFKTHGHKNGFAWQAIGGITYPVNEFADLFLEYRFYQPDVQKYNDHNACFGIRCNY